MNGPAVLHVRSIALVGVASCDVCDAFFSFRCAAPELEEKVERLRCPMCRSSSVEFAWDLASVEIELLNGTSVAEGLL